MAIERVAMIFDDRHRPETTGVYCLKALRELVDVEHFHPERLPEIPREGFDLYLNVDDGMRYPWPDDLHPCAWWAIDTHMDLQWSLQKSHGFDAVFAAQRDGAEWLRREGIASVTWLPLACDPSVHRRHEVEKAFDLCFVGNLIPGIRQKMVWLLQRHFSSMFVGQQYFDEMAQTYSASRIVFNRSVAGDINMRVFEGVACGSLLVTNELSENGQGELFRDGVHLATYRDEEELLDKVTYYLKRDELRERIAAAGRQEALAKHTYRHRMESLLGAVRKSCSEATVVPTACTPPRDWSYFEHARPELLAMVPSSARRVLDIGCATGRLGATLKQRQSAEVVGIELDGQAAEVARGRLDEVFAGDVETCEADFADRPFDCIVCGDILEHVREPDRLLRQARRWLAPEGRLIASIPNVRHHSVVRALLHGNWTYEPAGLLDRDHLRFFTRRDVEALFRSSGFQIEQLGNVPGPGYEQWEAKGRPGEVTIGRLHVAGMPEEEAEEFYVYQYLVRAVPNGAERPPDCNQVAEGRSKRGATSVMRFKQDFVSDFDQFNLDGPPVAFVRFGDGERGICSGVALQNSDGWRYDGRPSQFTEDLNASLRFYAPDYYIGISDGCCDRESRDWFLDHITAPMHQVTFANLFVNANYRRFLELDLSGTVVIASSGGDLWVPEDVMNSDFDLDDFVEQLLVVDRPMLVVAGPAACIIIHKYWMRATRKQTILDVGSALDERIKGKRSRGYHYPGSRTAELICTW